MKKTLALLIILLGITSCVNQTGNIELKHRSGDDEIDQIRKEIAVKPTNPDNFMLRAFMLKIWVPALQQQGAILTNRYMHIDSAFHSWGKVTDDDMMKRKEDVIKYSKIIDEGYSILDSIQNELFEDPSTVLKPHSANSESIKTPEKNGIPFPQYKGTETHTGFTGADGPVLGRIAWQYPVGLAWESSPVVVEDKVYLSSPGMRNVLTTLNINTGEVLSNVKQTSTIQWDQLYSTPSNASTPIILDKHILYREMGARGNEGPTKHIVYVNKTTGQIEKKIVAGHVDYRHGYAPFAANEKYLVFPHGIQDIHTTPPIAQAFNFIICKDAKTGQQLWKSNIGHFFAEPVLDSDDNVFIGTKTGYFYCYNAGPGKPDQRGGQNPIWKFKANDAINMKAAFDAEQVYFGSNDGSVYCLKKNSGELVWKYTVENPVSESFRHFSAPFVVGNKVFIGSADKNLYCINTSDGSLVFKFETNDWIRSRPIATGSNVYFASMNGEVYNLEYNQKEVKTVWKKRIGDHWIYADLTLSGNRILLNDSDLFCYCLDTQDGSIQWRHSIIKAFYKEDGYRILTDQIAGGAYYQSKATAADGVVYIGSPSRFVHALNSETGKEIWRYELGAAISGAPVIYNGRIYVGQQGGEEEFYCLDAKTGKLIWTQNVGWVWGSATVDDGMVFIPGIDGYLYALDAVNGAIVWRHRTEFSTCSEPLVMGDYVYFGGWDGFMYKFEKRTGKFIWRFQGGGSDSGVAIGFEGKILMPGDGMKCIDAETQEILWIPKVPRENFNVTPAYHDGRAFISALYGGGLGGLPISSKIVALDASNGKPYWTFDGPGGLTGPIVGNNGYVYCGSTTNPYFFAINAKGNSDGTTDCLFKIKMANKVEESTAAIYNGKAYILSSGGYLYAFE